MAVAQAENFTDWVTQKTRSLTSDKKLFEMKSPGYNAIKKATRTEPITQKGYRLPHWYQMPGGVGGFVPTDSSFNPYVPPSSRSMYVFPTYMAQPIVMDGAAIRMLKSGSEQNITNLDQAINLHYDVFTKRINHMIYGDGSGTLAVAGGAVSTLGTGQTLTGTTAAATTPGQTKGTVRLMKSHYYDAINPSTGAVRGTFYVETPGASSCTIYLLSGTISSGDYITDPNSYNRMPRGLGHLISNASRILQTLNTANDTNLNSPGVDLNGTLATPVTFDRAKVALQTRANEQGAENGLLCFCTFNFYALLKRQGWNLTTQGTDTTTGIARRYQDGDTTFILDADMDEDRAYLVAKDALVMFEEMEMGDFRLDGQEWRMLLGNHGTGSDSWQRAFGIAYNMGLVDPKSSAFIKRALISSSDTQVSVNS
ncbi:MAG TPA: hypothetical protein VN256_13180 [Pyrinomonadaceae bacterium]|nr:hypothetical protein [Pyrinomonadaceae bacterium]